MADKQSYRDKVYQDKVNSNIYQDELTNTKERQNREEMERFAAQGLDPFGVGAVEETIVFQPLPNSKHATANNAKFPEKLSSNTKIGRHNLNSTELQEQRHKLQNTSKGGRKTRKRKGSSSTKKHKKNKKNKKRASTKKHKKYKKNKKRPRTRKRS